jgi:hypothetical protein
MTLRRHSLLLGLVWSALGAAVAEAAITPTLMSVTPNVDGTFTYLYNVDLAADQIASGAGATPTGGTTPTGGSNPSTAFQDYFTIYDFTGLVGGSATQPAGWAVGYNLIGPTPSSTTPADDPALWNVFWVRTGDPVVGPADLGDFTVRSIFGVVALDSYTSDATGRNGSAGTAVASIGTAYVPQQTVPCTGCPTSPISEPDIHGSVWLGAALLGLGAVRWRRRALNPLA